MSRDAEAKVDDLIATINLHELYRRRQVRGRDLNDWHTALRTWKADGEHQKSLGLLTEIIDVVEGLDWLDAREPQLYWYESAAQLFAKDRRFDEAIWILNRWLVHWPQTRRMHPDVRAIVDGRRDRVWRRITRLERRRDNPRPR